MLPTRSSLSATHAARLALAALATVAALLLLPAPAPAVTLPPGFEQRTAIDALTDPMDVEITAGGRVFVAEKSGVIKTYDGLSDPRATTFADLRTQVHNFSSRGLLGLAVDPAFATNPYVYVYYTFDAPIGGSAPTFGTAGATSEQCPGDPDTVNCVVSARVSRLRVNGERLDGPEQVLVNDWCQQFPFHTGGGIEFGADGYLYVSGGDGARWGIWDYGQLGSPSNPCGDPPGGVGALLTPPTSEGGRLRAQDLRTSGDPLGLAGSLIRIDPATGAGVPGNPMFTSDDPNNRRMVAHGFRNPARLAIRPHTTDVWVADRGGGYWEELDRVQGGADPVRNFGWPCYEGGLDSNGDPYARIRPRSNDQDLNICENLYAEGNATAAPYWAYDHEQPVVAGEQCATDPVTGEPLGNQISGLNFYPASGSFPTAYRNALFFADRLRKCMYAMLPGADGLPARGRVIPFAQGAHRAIDIEVAPNGDLLYVDEDAQAVQRVGWTGNSANQTPIAVMQADALAGNGPLTVNFTSTGSSDPDAGDLLVHEWDLDGDGEFDDSTEPDVTHTFMQSGRYTVTLRVTDTSGATATDRLTIQVTEAAETAELTFTPVADARVEEATPTGNFGTSTRLQATASIPRRASYLRFDLAGITGRVVSAKLQLTSTTDGTKDGPALHGAGNGWTETGITWDTRPPHADVPAGDFGAIPLGTVAEYDATALVAGDGTVDMALVPTFNDNVDFGSREHADPTKRPQLVVTFETTSADANAPTAPAGLAADAIDHGRVQLAWSASTDDTGVVGYEIYRDGQLLATRDDATSYTDTTVAPRTAYEYTVKAFDGAGNRSAASAPAAVTTPGVPDPESPSAPASLVATAPAHDRVELSWAAATDNVGVTGYEVIRDGQVIATLADETSWADTSVSAETRYEYAVRALDAAGNRSPASSSVAVTTPAAPDTQAPAAPAGLEAQAAGHDRVDLTWSAATDNVGVVGYEIYRDGELLATRGTDTTYADTSVAPQQTYRYTVRALDAAQNRSAAGNEASVATPAAPVTLTFSAVADAYVDESASGNNFGTSPLLYAKGTGKKRESYLRFQLAGVNGHIQSAKLRLAPVADGTADGPAVHRVTGAWGETAITWSNRPARNSQPAADLGAIALGTVAEYDVRSLVNGDGPVDVALVSSSGDSVDFASRESSNVARRPQLVVTFVPAAADTEAPSAPASLVATAPAHDRVQLSWAAATDNVGVTGYEVMREGQVVATLADTTSWADTSVSPETRYEYAVRALDAAGNRSPASAPVAATTPAVPAAATTVVFDVAADAHVEGRSPGTNLGTVAKLDVVDSNRPAEAYLRFAPAGITGTVEAAKLRVYVLNDGSANGPAVYGAGSSWTESTLTWANRPSRTAAPAANAGAIAARTWVEYDVLPLVSGNGDVTFALVGDSADSANFSSREGSDPTKRAVLEVTFRP